MPKIPGHLEWDDEDLTPGNAKDGGLHQNLFRDGERGVKDHARFIPAEDDTPDPDVVYVVSEPEVIYVERERSWEEEERERRAEERERRAEEAKRQQDLEDTIKVLVLIAIAAKPHVERLWETKVRPAWEERKARRLARKAAKAARRSAVVSDATVVEAASEVAVAVETPRLNMTSAEQQARLLAGLLAKQFSDEQFRLVANSSTVEDEGVAMLERALVELPPHQVTNILEAVRADPSVLGDNVLNQLGQILRPSSEAALPIRMPEES